MPDTIRDHKPIFKDWRTYAFWLITSSFGAGGSYLGFVQGMNIEIVKLQGRVETLEAKQKSLEIDHDDQRKNSLMVFQQILTSNQELKTKVEVLSDEISRLRDYNGYSRIRK